MATHSRTLAWKISRTEELVGPKTKRLQRVGHEWATNNFTLTFRVVVVNQSLNHIQLFEIPWPAARQTSLSFTVSWSLLKLKSIESMMPSSHYVLSCPLLSSTRAFSNELGFHIRWPSIGASTSASVPPMIIQDRFPLWLIGLISLQSKEFSRIFSNTTELSEYIMGNARLDESWARIKIAERNINNLRYANKTTLMAGPSFP